MQSYFRDLILQNIWMIFSDIFKFLARTSHFAMQHDAEHATLTRNNATQSFRNDLNGLKHISWFSCFSACWIFCQCLCTISDSY